MEHMKAYTVRELKVRRAVSNKKRGKRKIGILDGKATFKEKGDGKITLEEFLGL
jgi:hypothetical protein